MPCIHFTILYSEIKTHINYIINMKWANDKTTILATVMFTFRVNAHRLFLLLLLFQTKSIDSVNGIHSAMIVLSGKKQEKINKFEVVRRNVILLHITINWIGQDALMQQVNIVSLLDYLFVCIADMYLYALCMDVVHFRGNQYTK